MTGEDGELSWWEAARRAGDGRAGERRQWRAWLTASPEALRIGGVVAVAAGAGLVVAALVCVMTAMTKRPLPGVGLVLGLATPVVFLGHVWTIGVLAARRAAVPGGLGAKVSARARAWKNPRAYLFGALPAEVAYGLIGAFVVGWWAALTAFPALSLGKPIFGTDECPWALVKHGAVSCVSESTYDETRAAAQRLPAGAVMAFLAVHCGVALNELVRRGRLDSSLP